MALSNWDTLAVNEKGEATNGIFVSPKGVTVEIYKNCLSVYESEKEKYMMTVFSGSLRYRDAHINAVAGPKKGIYFVVSSTVSSWELAKGCGKCKTNKKGEPKFCKDHKDDRTTAMVGIGCYGYRGGEWVGIEQGEVDFLRRFMDGKDNEGYETFSDDIIKIDLSKALRFNQGDAYFADRLGFDIPVGSPGDTGAPLLEQMLKKGE